MAARHISPNPAVDLASIDAPPPAQQGGAEGLGEWLATLRGLFRAAGDFEPEAPVGA
jgi:hypothetical protein